MIVFVSFWPGPKRGKAAWCDDKNEKRTKKEKGGREAKTITWCVPEDSVNQQRVPPVLHNTPGQALGCYDPKLLAPLLGSGVPSCGWRHHRYIIHCSVGRNNHSNRVIFAIVWSVDLKLNVIAVRVGRQPKKYPCGKHNVSPPAVADVQQKRFGLVQWQLPPIFVFIDRPHTAAVSRWFKAVLYKKEKKEKKNMTVTA